jgi:hypothetical protein
MSDTTNTMTPYAAATLINAQLKEMGFEKKLPPQMLYTYVGKGYIKSVEVDGKKRVTNEALATWFVGYVNKLNGNKAQAPASTEPSVWNFADLAEQETDTSEEIVDEVELYED